MSGRAVRELSRSRSRSNGFHSSSDSSIDTSTPTSRQCANRGSNSLSGHPLPNGPQTNTTWLYCRGSTDRQSTPSPKGGAVATAWANDRLVEPAAHDVAGEQVAGGRPHLLEAEPAGDEDLHRARPPPAHAPEARASSRSLGSTLRESKHSTASSCAARACLS